MHKMYLVIGDWSGDGHGKFEKVLVEVNKNVEKVQNAYKESCKLTGISFNENEDYTENGRNWKSASRFHVAVEYETPELSPDVLDVLEKFNCPSNIIKNYNEEACHKTFIDLWFWFVSLSLPDLEYKEIENIDKIPCINGYWNKNLNVDFGYGLYI